MTPESEGVRLDREGELATITLDRPEKRNALTPATLRVLTRVGRDLLATGARVVVLRAEGPSFSAGFDRAMLRPDAAPDEPSLAALVQLDDAALDDVISGYQEAFTWWRDERIVTVAAVQGHAVGAGLQLALACDLRVMAADARLAMREPSLGLVPDLGGTKPLVELVGYPRALEICVTGREVEAAEAVRLGLAELVVPPADLDATVRDLCAAVLATPAHAVRATKALLRGSGSRSYDEQRAAERAAQLRLLRALAGQQPS